MHFLTRQVKLFDWNDRQLGQFDLLKGLFVIGMIISHCLFPSVTEAFINPNHSKLITALMLLIAVLKKGANVMIFIICGMGFRKMSVRSTARLQLRHLGKPYLYTILGTFVTVSLFSLFTGRNLWAELSTRVLPIILGNTDGFAYFGIPMLTCGPIWFIVVFFTSGIILSAILQIKDEPLQWLTVLLLYGMYKIGFRRLFGLSVGLPFGINRSLEYTLYMYIGWQIKKKRFFDLSFPVWMLILAAIYMLPSIYIQQLDAIFSLFMALGILAFCLWVQKKTNNSKSRSTKCIRTLGQQIMPCCCFHTVIYQTIDWQSFYNANRSHGILLSVAVITVIYIITFIIGCILFHYIKRRKTAKASAGNGYGQR